MTAPGTEPTAGPGTEATAGPSDEVVKFLAPLTLTDEERDRGIEICYEAVDHVLAQQYG